MSAYGFDGAKNKVLVMTVEDFSDAVGEIVNPQLATKQNQHLHMTRYLTSSGWSTDQGGHIVQTISVEGVTSSNTVFVSPAPSDVDEYSYCGVVAYAQGSGTLSFMCKTKPTNSLSVNIVVLGV